MSPQPIDRPGKIVCVGLNYRDHAAEQGVAPPEHPILFAKWQTALVGPGEPIVLPPVAREVDYEAELGVIMQFSDGQWTRAKSIDTFCPVGPRFVPREEIPDPQALWIRCTLNGEVMQDSSTAEMIFSVAEVIAFASRTMTLEPDDLIATGTPAGVGFTREPPVFLKDGDEVTVEIDGLGALTNPVLREG